MKSKLIRRLGVLGVFATALAQTVGTMGCASERDPINRVQPDYLKKSDLVGTDPKNPSEWYMRNTIVEASQTNTFAQPGTQDTLKRIRWDIEEDYLVARKSYELVSGSDGKGGDPSKNDGVVVAAYPILSHFDIQRSYIENTGEEQNVIVENTTDRPWYDRQYIRVDWSRNTITDPDGLFWWDKIYGEISWAPVEWSEKDPKSRNAPVLDQTANGYLDVTQKWIARAADLGSGGWPPTCLILNIYTGSEVMECNPQEMAVRVSFMKVGQRDYQPMETNSATWSMFGTFTRDRYGFSRDYELTDQNWHRMVARHNLWKESHEPAHEECVSGDQAASDSSCATKFGAGSVCDKFGGESYGKAGVCTLPLAKREVKTIPYYVAQSMPTEFWPTNQKLISEWNDAIVNGIAVGREVECRSAGGDQASCHGQFFDGELPNASNGPALTLCHNPVADGDSEACGEKGLAVREGDLRYNLIGYVTQSAGGLLGYAPSAADPRTGEVVQANAFIYGGSIDNYATMARDLVLVANGELDASDFALGKNLIGNIQDPSTLTDQQKAAFSTYQQALAGKRDESSAMSAAEMASRMKGLDPSAIVNRLASNGVTGSAVDRLRAVESGVQSRGIEGSKGFGGRAEALQQLQDVADKLKGSKSETALLVSQDFDLSGQNGATDLKLAQESSPFSGGISPFTLADMESKLEAHLEDRGECLYGRDEFNAPHIEGLARRFKDKFKDLSPTDRKQALFQALRQAIYRATTEHEMGHTMTLRHNFQGSWDSMNYHPNYWKLRTNSGKAVAACATTRTGDNDTCMGPRYLDPETDEELGKGASPHSGIEEFAYSSIMDYGYDFNTDLHGLGSYDRAAMKFIYGNAVETFKAGSAVANQVAPLHATADTTHARGALSEEWWVKRNDAVTGNAIQPTHYTTLARMLQSEGLLFDASRCRAAREDEELDAIGGQVCDPVQRDHASVTDLVSSDIEPGVTGSLWKTKDGRIRWPYRFGTDQQSTRPHNLRFDAGADIYEASTNVARLYEARYVLDNFRRGRRGWMPFFGSRAWDRYFSRMHSLGWLSASKIALYGASYPTSTPATNPALQSDDWGRGYALASTVLFEALEKAVLRPQPGDYTQSTAVGGQALSLFGVPESGNATGTFSVGILDGRWIDDDVNNEKGGSFNYGKYLERLGTHAEKPFAIAALAAQFPPFQVDFARDSYVDGRNMLLNFRSILPKAYDRLMAGVLANDTDVVAPFVDSGAVAAGNPLAVSVPHLWDADYSFGRGNVHAVDPLVGFKLQVPTIMYTLWLGQSNGDQSFQGSMRVWVEGGPDSPVLPDAEKEIFQEFGSGVTWVARKYGTETVNGFTKPIGIGHRMITHANQLLGAAYCVQTNADGTAKYDASHNLLWQAGKQGQVCDQGNADATKLYQRYVGLLNVTRDYLWDTKGTLQGY